MYDDKHCWPIIYVRGYAMTTSEQDDTAADPFCGFNLGSTVYRATTNKNKTLKLIFESPLIRLSSEFGYGDVYEDGLDILDKDWKRASDQQRYLAKKSIIIFRYYDQASQLLGSGQTPSIETFAKQLGELIQTVRDMVCGDTANGVSDPKDFRCYLVAHSMGGLVVRAFLQNPALDESGMRGHVDKVFTYATPHNGIDMGGVNVPSWLSKNDISNFNRERMAGYLNLETLFRKTDRVDWMPESVFPSERFFCMVGTNRNDYEVAKGLSRTFTGQGSDGLVRIANASVWGVDDAGHFSKPSPTAYAYRSHSGYFGIVNSEEAYQNLVRFLFGDFRADVWFDIKQVTLPTELQSQEDNVDATYQFEFLAATKGARWYLTRRVAEEDSVACKTYKQLKDPHQRSIYLSTVFLSKHYRVNREANTLTYTADFGVRVPDYEVDRKFWFDGHFEGGYLFNDRLIITITLPDIQKGQGLMIQYGWWSLHKGKTPEAAALSPGAGGSGQQFSINLPPGAATDPTISGQLRFVASTWNS
ncbi:MAG: hypothetical protein PHT19_09780 [Methylococcus sp.]|nr:hypothetical protein [Methylococcus sp.]